MATKVEIEFFFLLKQKQNMSFNSGCPYVLLECEMVGISF